MGALGGALRCRERMEGDDMMTSRSPFVSGDLTRSESCSFGIS